VTEESDVQVYNLLIYRAVGREEAAKVLYLEILGWRVRSVTGQATSNRCNDL
jgi:hypothetical protein